MRSIRVPISLRLALLIVVAQAILYAAFAFLIMRGSTEAVEASERETFKLLSDTIRWSVEDEIGSAALSIVSIAEDPKVIDLFARRDRGGLYDYLQPVYGKIKDRVVRFHFHLPDGVSFLRLHERAQYGDSLIESRPMIRSALALRTTVSGIERGKDGLGLRVVAPLFDRGEFIGAVEFGMEYGEAFTRKLQAKYDGDYYLFEFDESGNPRFIAGTRSAERCPLAERSLDELQAGEAVWSLDCSHARGVGLYPYRDYSGAVIGFVKAELLRIPLSEAVGSVQRRLILLGIVLAAVLILMTTASMRALLRPLRAVVVQTRHISARILAGDLGYRGNVSETAEEFRDIIGAVNGIIATLRERESVLQAIVEGIPGVVFYVDSAYRVVWANERAQVLMPTLVGSRLGGGEAERGFFERESELLAAAFADGDIVSFEACYLKDEPAGRSQECWEHVAVPVRSRGEAIDHVVRISGDVTARRRAEADLRSLNETLERRVDDEIAKRKEGERIASQQSRLAAIGELATGMAHEITQPLNAIAFSIENLRARFGSGNLDSAYLEAKTQAVGADIDRVRRVIDHVRLFARSAPDEYRVGFSVNNSVENAVALLGVQMATHGIDMDVDLDGSLPDAYGNPFQYEQVALNLLTNARDAIEERLLRETEADASDTVPGAIAVRTSASDGSIVLDIEDNGTGIPEDLRMRVFDPFFTTKAPGKGTGLGLSISFGIIRDMGGAIEIEAREPGTRFRVIVPAGNL
jgi:signal transduction histidine kinase